MWPLDFETGHSRADFLTNRMSGSGRVCEITDGRFVEAKQEERRPAVRLLWRNPAGSFGVGTAISHGREAVVGAASRPFATRGQLYPDAAVDDQQVYSADTDGHIYAELASILRKTSGLADVLVQALSPAAHKLRVAFVFGSVAQSRETSGSDIDVMLIGDLSFRQAVELLHPTQAALGREVNPKVFASEESVAKLRVEPFLADVLAKPKLFLIGNAHDLAELAGHQP